MEERPRELSGPTYKIKTPCGNMYLTINKKNELPYEAFITGGHSGVCFNAISESFARLISLSFRYKVPLDEISDQMKGINCNRTIYDDIEKEGKKQKIISCIDGISGILKRYKSEHLDITK